MKLYFAPGACSLAPHILLREAGLNFVLEKVDLKAKKTASGEDFLKVNPKGYVPALRLANNEVLTEGPAIMQYIADRAPGSNLAPAPTSFERYHLQEWLNFITSEIHKSFSPLFRDTTPEEYKAITKLNLGNRFIFLNTHLSQYPFLMGNTFTVADAYLFVTAGWSRNMKIDLSRWPALQKFLDEVGKRPAVQEAMRAEGLIKESGPAK